MLFRVQDLNEFEIFEHWKFVDYLKAFVLKSLYIMTYLRSIILENYLIKKKTI